MSDIQYEYNEKNGIIFDELGLHTTIAQHVRHLFLCQDYALTMGRAFSALETFRNDNYREYANFKKSRSKTTVKFPTKIRKIYKNSATKEIQELNDSFETIRNERNRIFHNVTVTFNINTCISYLKQINDIMYGIQKYIKHPYEHILNKMLDTINIDETSKYIQNIHIIINQNMKVSVLQERLTKSTKSCMNIVKKIIEWYEDNEEHVQTEKYHFAEIYVIRGMIYRDTGEYNKAIIDFTTAIEIDDMHAKAYNNRGTIYRTVHKYDTALADFDTAIEIDDKYVNAYINRGYTYYIQQASNKQFYVKEDYKKALEIDPKNGIASFLYGLTFFIKIFKNLYIHSNDRDFVLQLFTAAIDSDSSFLEAYIFRGMIYTQLDEYTKAINEYTHIIEFNCKKAMTHNNCDKKETIDDYKEAIDFNNNCVSAYNNRGLVYDQIGKYDQAIDDYSKALEIDRNFVDTYNNRGAAYEQKKEYNKAVADYNKAIELNPANANAYNNRGVAYEQKKEYNKAVADYNKAIELKPTNANAYNNRGNVYRKKGKYAQTLTDYNKAIELNPANAETYYNRGLAYTHIGENDKAHQDIATLRALQRTDLANTLEQLLKDT